MAKTRDDIENYILGLGVAVHELAAGTWLLEDSQWEGLQIAVHLTDPLVVFRVKLFDLHAVPAERQAALFKHLLTLNGTDMVQGAYALEGNDVVVVEVMQLENLDTNEFQAAIDCLTFALTVHYPELKNYIA